MKTLRRSLLALFSFALSFASFGLGSLPVHAAGVTNRIIQGSGPTLYWVDTVGTRYTFPNAATYYTWFPDFNNILKVTDAEVGSYPDGGMVTYRPGAKLVKFPDSSKVYAVSRFGVLRHVTSESVARGLYGWNWASQLHDVPTSLRYTYRFGDSIYNTWGYNVSEEYHSALGPSKTGPVTTVTAPGGYITSMSLAVSDTSFPNNSTIRVTANAYNTGNVNYSGKRIDIIDTRNGATIVTCHNQSWCATNVYVSKYWNESNFQYRTLIRDEYGTILKEVYSPTVYFTN